MTWWRGHMDRRPVLLARNRIQAALRAWFAEQGFTEVDPACLTPAPGPEVHLHTLETEVMGPDMVPRRAWLQTSPEFAMKKLLAGGETRIFAFAHVWRNREGGPRHTPEFTMLEWYRADAPYDVLIDDCAAVLRVAAEAAGTEVFRHGEVTCDPRAAPARVTVADACAAQGVDLMATLPGGRPDTARLAAELDRAGIAHAPGEVWSDLFSRLLTERVEPALGPGPVVLDAYPAPEAALARRAPADPRLAERFELFACGVELANAFGELTDPAEQAERFEADMARRAEIHGTRDGRRDPIDTDFLEALAEMPPASGIALGFDRLVMLATGAPRVSDVQWAPFGL